MLVNVNCDLKICDFGLARGINYAPNAEQPSLDEDQEYGDALTKYVVTRWYRAPEVVLRSANYDESIDLWAVGCVFAELMGRQPLFPGKNHLNQVQMIQQFVGKIPEDDLMAFEDKVARDYLIRTEKHLGLEKQLS